MSYHRPDNLEAALAIRAEGAVVAAGCTDLFPATQAQHVAPTAGAVLDITAIPGLRGVSETTEGLRIGAATTWTDIVRAPLPPAFDGLKAAAREVGSVQIQNSGTIAGNLCNASPAADGVPPLLTLDASVELLSAKGARALPLQDFLTGPRQTALQDDEIVAAISIPAGATAGVSSFYKLGARRHLVISIAMAAARMEIENGVVARAALAVGSCSPVAQRLQAVEAALVGKPLDPAIVRDADVATSLSPIDDVRADAGYRLDAAAEITRRAIATLTEAAE